MQREEEPHQRIAVFGASGRTGRLVVDRALADGHIVTAVARHPEAGTTRHERLRVVRGDVLEAASIRRALEGQDAVISAVGVPYSPFKRIRVYSVGARHILDAMRQLGVRRFVGVTSGGTNPHRAPGSPLVFEWIIKPLIGRTLYADMRRMEELVMDSDLEWTIVRPAALVDQSAGSAYRVEPGYMVPGMTATARADLADVLVRAVTQGVFVRQAVAVASPRAKTSSAADVGPGRSRRRPWLAWRR
jgi:putative NADH-flavin reductase